MFRYRDKLGLFLWLRRLSPLRLLFSKCCKVGRNLCYGWNTFGERDVGVRRQVLVNDFSIFDDLPLFVFKFLQLLANCEKVVEEGDVGLKSRVLFPFLLENR